MLLNPLTTLVLNLCIATVKIGSCQVICTLFNFMMPQRWLVLGGTILKKQHLLKTLVTWGPTFKISLKLFINSFVGHNLQNGNLAEVLRFTTTDNDCCAIGDRIPAIFTTRRGFLQVTTHVGANGNKKKNFRLNEKTWYTLEIKQYRKNNKVS